MKPASRQYCLTFLLAAYLLTSQATVIALVLQWYSTAAHQSVQMRFGAAQEQAELRWSPRTHLPFAPQSEFSPTEPARFSDLPAVPSVERLPLQPPRLLGGSEYFALLANKAPPQS